MAATSFRSDVRDGLFAYITAFMAANTTTVAAVHKVRPGSFVPPCMYVGSLNEPNINQTGGPLRQRLMAPTVVLVQRIIVPDNDGEAMDDMVDAYLDYVTANPHMGGGIIQPVSTQDIELDLGGTIYSATVVTHRAEILEGRN